MSTMKHTVHFDVIVRSSGDNIPPEQMQRFFGRLLDALARESTAHLTAATASLLAPALPLLQADCQVTLDVMSAPPTSAPIEPAEFAAALAESHQAKAPEIEVRAGGEAAPDGRSVH